MKLIQRIAGVASLLLCVSVLTAVGQDPYDVETRPVRGFMPNMNLLSSPIDHIDPVSGNVHLEIPLASLATGKTGSDFELKLVYDSHLYDVLPQLIYPPVGSPPEWQPTPAWELNANLSTGGWKYNIFSFKIDYEQRSDVDIHDNSCPETAQRAFRLRVGVGDGSLHTLHLQGYGDSWIDQYRGDGFYGMAWSGKSPACARHWGWPAQTTGWLTYFTTDGSYLKFETLADGQGVNQLWYLYFPDGRRMTGHGAQVEAIYDSNGNGIHFTSGCSDPLPGGLCGQAYTSIVNDLGREIRIEYNLTHAPWWEPEQDRVTVQGPNGPVVTTINWDTMFLGQGQRSYQWSDAPWDTTRPLNFGIRRLNYVQLPLAAAVPLGSEPPVWNSYAFGYADDADGGYGEVDSVRTPLGSTFLYRYWAEGLPMPTTNDIAHWNPLKERKLLHDGVELTWNWDFNGNSSVVTGPDGAQTTYSWLPFGAYRVGPAGAWSDKLVYRIDQPNGIVIKRVWAPNFALDAVGDDGSYRNQLNAYVQRETISTGNSVGDLAAVTERSIDQNGNLLSSTEYDWVSFDASGPEVGVNPRRTIQHTYYATVPAATAGGQIPNDLKSYWNPHFGPLSPEQPRRLDALRRKEVRDGASIVAVTEFDYDDAYRSGNVTKTWNWDSVKAAAPGLGLLDPTNSQELRREYGVHGNLRDIFDPEVRTHITYDPTGSFPTLVQFAYGTSAQRSWSYNWNTTAGTLISKTDNDNNITTAYHYDNVGRITALIEVADPGLLTGVRKTETEYDDPNRRVTVKKDLRAFGNGELRVTTEYDALGRVVLVQNSEPGNPSGIKVNYTYYPTLNRTVQSSPYRTTADATLEWTCTQKDTSGRVTEVAIFKSTTEPTDCLSTANRTGVTRMIYDSNWTSIIDPAGKHRAEQRDALGRLIEVVEDPGVLDYHTYYGYDQLDNLTSVLQAPQPQRTFQYSSLSRLLSAWNPESGTTNYTYNDGGSLSTRTDARGVVATFGYDDMHRIRTKTYTNDSQSTPAVTYNYYTSGSPNVGQLHSVVSSAATTEHTSYDVLGRVTGSTHTVSGYSGPQSFTYDYWLSDAVKSVQYPSGRIVNYDVDDAGRTNKVRDMHTTFADLTNIASPFTPYTADGRISAMRLGNELWETRDYQTPGTPTKYKVGTALGDNQLLELEYNFSGTANNGNLVSHVIRNYRFNPVRTWSQSYSYDGVNRIACAAEAVLTPADPCTHGDWRQVFGYDRYGNRWVSSVTGLTGTDVHEPTVETNFNPSTNRLVLQGSDYDLAGNQTIYTPYTLTYDAENRNVSATSPSNGSGTFTYDGDGHRVKKTWTNSGGTTTTYYFRNALGQLAVEYSTEPSPTPGRVYVHTDMLGSTRLVTGDKPANWPSSTASIMECYDYLPFGRMLNSGDSLRDTGCYPPNPDYEISSRLPQKFTGQERDTETRLDYFGARYYSAAQGRFISADPGPFVIADPQSWNRYSYVQNNPAKYVDPTGTTLTLTGTYANDFLQMLEQYTGFDFDWDDATGLVTLDKRQKRNPAVGSKNLAKLLKKMIGDKKNNVSIAVEENQPRVLMDRFRTREVDFADLTAVDKAFPELGAAQVGHILGEYYSAAKAGNNVGIVGFDMAHQQGLKLEGKVMSDYTHKKEQSPPDTVLASPFRIIYRSVTYDILLKTGLDRSVDVDSVRKTQNRKPGVP